ncbi:GNAT family N-acetyltransferase [Pediococcus claussenii]|uniref:Acetyltransferase family protein n=1 Tax=Pediococcus claussenii (strain ATCC BAA-344 / DSM 14800 / JCM 18046 / KCTC 3811 / LMG 21948 / P06) TaxID=701521 RepID=G8PED2_PEDCP|nr:GNAT family N-acetyltransferase [Pediococcus claussenii]AEV94393.1 acetyltransferase family protein [Pediococcus claussenii ATCC BAA-344]ANZ69614.1 hypothetical protein AYR57_04490 [Pediococcus claussenii]ANZ71431.1 hypothetical protein AYR58_04495 [Pediococcus claussenii]KRN19903.1 hypothetical protein IV79_GL001192 [Pediococcus claussenii]
MEIKRTHFSDELTELLLSADPSLEMIKSYIYESNIWIIKKSTSTVGIIIVKILNDESAEIKNIAVLEAEQHQGLGTKLIEFVSDYYAKQGIKDLLIGTGNSSFKQLKLYQELGFHIYGLLPDFFIKNYSKPIFENKIRCESMIKLRKRLNN